MLTGAVVNFPPSGGSVVLAKIPGPSECGTVYQSITYERSGTVVTHDCAPTARMSVLKRIIGHSGGHARFRGLDSSVSCTASGSSAGGGDGVCREASNFNCTFFPGCVLSNWLAVEGAGVGHGRVPTHRAVPEKACQVAVP